MRDFSKRLGRPPKGSDGASPTSSPSSSPKPLDIRSLTAGEDIPLTREQLIRLEEAFRNQASNLEACALARCSMAQLLFKIGTEPEWYQAVTLMANYNGGKSKVNLGDAIEAGDVGKSMEYLERRQPKDWGRKQEVEHGGQLEWKVTVAPFMLPESRRQVIDVESKPVIEDEHE